MNYYERHIGDYLKDTSHLSLLEHGVYSRLLDVYYTREGAIPESQVARLISARSKDERDALSAVLEEFFTLIDGCWHQGRCDAEIEEYQGKQADKPAAKDNAKERQRRARERRSQLFEALRSHGVTLPYKATTSELEAELSRVTSQDMSRRVTCDASHGVTRDDTATQTPDTRHQTTPLSTQSTSTSVAPDPSPGARVCLALKPLGIRGNPSHPMLQALVDAGATPQEFVDAAPSAHGKADPFAYLLGVVQGRRRDAADVAKGLHKGPIPPTQSKPPTAAEMRVFRSSPQLMDPAVRARCEAFANAGKVAPEAINFIDMETHNGLAIGMD